MPQCHLARRSLEIRSLPQGQYPPRHLVPYRLLESQVDPTADQSLSGDGRADSVQGRAGGGWRVPRDRWEAGARGQEEVSCGGRPVREASSAGVLVLHRSRWLLARPRPSSPAARLHGPGVRHLEGAIALERRPCRVWAAPSPPRRWGSPSTSPGGRTTAPYGPGPAGPPSTRTRRTAHRGETVPRRAPGRPRAQ